MSFSIRLKQKLAQSLRLSLEQRIKIQQLAFSLRMALIQELRGERYEPRATCPECSREMTPVEIMKGFKQDPNDFTTCCSACGYRFEPILVCFGDGTSITIPFYCDMQTLSQLQRLGAFLSPEQIESRNPGVYRSAIIHHGGLRRAFERIGIRYDFEEIHDWKSKVIPFLGRMPDTIIADCANASISTVRALRRKLGVSRYTLHKTLEEADV